MALALTVVLPQTKAESEEKKVYKGVVYSATRGGHMVFTHITIDGERDLISGSVAGRLVIPNSEQADALEMSPDQKYIYYPTWDTSILYTIDISDKLNPKVISEKKVFDKPTRYCGSHYGPDGKLYLSSMTQGDIHVFDISNPLDPKLMDKTTYLCGVQVIEDGKYIWTTDIKEHKIYIYNPKTNERIGEIIPGGKEFLHRARLSSDKRYLFQSSTGAVSGQPAYGRVYIIDAKKKKVKDTIMLGEDYDPHDTALTPDGKYGIIAARRVPPKDYKDSEYVVVNLEKKRVIGSISMCKSCHNAMGVDPAAEKEREVFICGIQITWGK